MRHTFDTSDWTKPEEAQIQGTVVNMLHAGGYPYVPGSVHMTDNNVMELELDGEFPFTDEQILARIHEIDAQRVISALHEDV